MNTYIKKYTTQLAKVENGDGSLELHHHPPANISDVCGASWWSIIHGVATSIRDGEGGCSTCGEHAVSLMEYAHDLVNVSLEKPAQKPHAVREWTPYALQLATMPEYESAIISQNQRSSRNCQFNKDTFDTNPVAVQASLKELRKAHGNGDAQGFVNELNSLCKTKQKRMPLSQSAEVKIRGSCKPQGCTLEATTGGKAVIKEPKIRIPITDLTPEGIESAVSEARKQLAAALGETPPPAAPAAPTGRTLAESFGEEPRKKKDSKVVRKKPMGTTFAQTNGDEVGLFVDFPSLKEVVASNLPETGEVNPAYPGWLQPRNRERALNMVQVRKMAANLDPSRLLTDYHSLDRGTPVVVSRSLLESKEKLNEFFVVSGNGRAMAIQLAAESYPEVYARYVEALEEKMGWKSGMGNNKMLVRIISPEETNKKRLREIAELGNVSAAIATSTVEQAGIDSAKLTAEFIARLQPLEDETATIEETIRAQKNRGWVTEFLGMIPETELAAVADSKGRLSESGVRRVVMALAMWVFGVEDGNRISEIAFESTNQTARNIVQGSLRAVPRLATMIARLDSWVADASGEQVQIAIAARDELNISPIIAKAILRYIDLRRSGITIGDALAQHEMEGFIDTTDLMRKLLLVFDKNSRSAKRISEILIAYTEQVENIQSPNQSGFFDQPEDRVTSGTAERLLDQAVETENLLEPVAMFQRQRANVRLDKILLEARI